MVASYKNRLNIGRKNCCFNAGGGARFLSTTKLKAFISARDRQCHQDFLRERPVLRVVVFLREDVDFFAAVDFLAEIDAFRPDVDFFGTFLPFLRASHSPMAMACLRLLTLPPLPPGPLFNVPFFFLLTALFTSLPLLREYWRAISTSKISLQNYDASDAPNVPEPRLDKAPLRCVAAQLGQRNPLLAGAEEEPP